MFLRHPFAKPGVLELVECPVDMALAFNSPLSRIFIYNTYMYIYIYIYIYVCVIRMGLPCAVNPPKRKSQSSGRVESYPQSSC